MKKLLVILALACVTVCAYAQKDIPAGGCMEVASAGGDDEFTLYKVKDREGNPSFFLSDSPCSEIECIKHTHTHTHTHTISTQSGTLAKLSSSFNWTFVPFVFTKNFLTYFLI